MIHFSIIKVNVFLIFFFNFTLLEIFKIFKKRVKKTFTHFLLNFDLFLKKEQFQLFSYLPLSIITNGEFIVPTPLTTTSS